MSVRATVLTSVLALLLATLVAPYHLPAQPAFTTGGSTGTDFWITVPPNEINPFPVDALEVYLVSEFDTEVTIYDAAADKSFKRQLNAGQIKTLSDKTGETNWTWEVREYEQVVQKGIRITSTKPISVYVLNSKVTSTDGYMALPTSSWGTDYIVTSYYDFKEFKDWAGGFCIVAKENCKVTITLKGSGKDAAKTSGGRKIGDTFTVNMDAGSVYCVVGDGTTRGEFDLTGTSISSSAPVGLFGFHQRTTMPNLLVNGNGRDHLVEMTPPVQMFGLRTATVQLERTGTDPDAKGDVFRVLASEDNTRWSLKTFDLATGGQIVSAGGVLSKAGDFVELAQSTGPAILPHGVSIWEADKPILVTQFATSASFDGDNLHDPFMIHLYPIEEAGSTIIAATPTDDKFTTHHLRLIITLDSNANNEIDLLKQIKVNGEPLWNHPQSSAPTLLFNEVVPGIYYARLTLTSSVDAITVDAPEEIGITGYIYGYGQVDSYGWPILGSRSGPYPYTDTLEPVISEITNSTLSGGSQRVMHYRITEVRNDPDPMRDQPLPTDQVESGIREISLVDNLGNDNAVLTFISTTDLSGIERVTEFDVTVSARDTTLDVDATLMATDKMGNVGTVDVQKQGLLRFPSDGLDFGRITLGMQVVQSVAASNHSGQDQTFERIESNANPYFTSMNVDAGMTFVAGDTSLLRYEYDARRETTNYKTDHDVDTLRFYTTAGYSTLYLRGVAGTYLAEGEDLNFGIVPPASTPKCLDVVVFSIGSFPITVDSISGFAGSPFEFNAIDGRFTDPIEPGEIRKVGFACYDPVDTDGDTVVVTIHSRENQYPDSTAQWIGNVSAVSVADVTALDEGFSVATDPPFIRISVPEFASGSIVINDLVGNHLNTITVHPERSTMQIDTGGWASGTYVITFIWYEGASTRLIQVMR